VEKKRVFEVEIEGVRPLLMHSPASLSPESKGRSKLRPAPEEEAEDALYKDKEGRIVVPARCILGALREAAKDFPMAGKGKKSYKSYVAAGILIEPEDIPLITEGVEPEEAWEVDLKPVVVGKARIMRARPRFDRWGLKFTLYINDPMLDPEVIKKILEAAGQYQGLLDYRPTYGLFRVKGFNPVD
jgi:F420-dependent methylenetetrahydromethanopterin dehydrogenase